MEQHSDLGYWCFDGPGAEQTWKCNESRPTSHFGNRRWDKLASVMVEFVTSKHPVFKRSHMLQTGFFDISQRKTWNALQKRATKQSHARDCGIGVQSMLCVFEV